MSAADSADGHGVFVPVLIVAAAFVLWTGFQTVELMREHNALTATHDAQRQPLADAAKLRTSLDAVASATRHLADEGNPDAKLIVDELRKRGITINPDQASPSPPR